MSSYQHDAVAVIYVKVAIRFWLTVQLLVLNISLKSLIIHIVIQVYAQLKMYFYIQRNWKILGHSPSLQDLTLLPRLAGSIQANWLSLSFHFCLRQGRGDGCAFLHIPNTETMASKRAALWIPHLMSESLVAKPENGELVQESLCREGLAWETLLSGPWSRFSECVLYIAVYTLTTIIEPRGQNFCLALFVRISLGFAIGFTAQHIWWTI